MSEEMQKKMSTELAKAMFYSTVNITVATDTPGLQILRVWNCYIFLFISLLCIYYESLLSSFSDEKKKLFPVITQIFRV